MYRNGHYGAALLFVTPISAVLISIGFVRLAFVAGITAVGFAMVPDLDQRLPGVTHRGLTHTVWFALVVGFLLAGAGTVVTIAPSLIGTVTGFAVGTGTIMSHIAADALTPAGVRPWSPVDDTRYSLDIVRAKNPLANYALLGLGIASATLGIWTGGTAAGL
ncbi:metal-dependent hydrolase [Haloarcula sp. JP-Z28]|jgi:inner membrane protein|uniref:Metal-dependent hydrolase n=2 Tax=Haloarcula marismortui TaxID=2238 RepID=Q5V827_HALMA|nr:MULTISPECIES: metal-dependent hydrolase [Haloarcula]AAV44325.1 putative membrane-bound metal-dependent hydrolase [Haloarcula marismortui ATCC 43049]NHN64339.1 metal-dependent hydrolase [Haloarcula sp. JP-Z28]QCP89373.1 metal-dependent hydrolase [Haloarcula marismortui ATCC 43049]